MTTTTIDLSAEDILTRTEALVPLLREHAAEINTKGVLTRDVVSAMGEAGLWRLATPPAFGGPGFPTSAVRARIFRLLGSGTPAAGWSVMNTLTEGWDVAHLAGHQAAAEMFATPHDGPLVAGSGPSFTYNVAYATAVEGGYWMYGRFGFASGVRLTAWLSGSVVLVDADGTERLVRMLVPREDFRIADDWHVAGMGGTASNTAYIPEDEAVFVPQHRMFEYEDFPVSLAAVVNYMAIMIGAADAALEEFIARSKKRFPFMLPYESTIEMPTVHALIGRTTTKISIAWRVLTSFFDRIDAHESGEDPAGDDEFFVIIEELFWIAFEMRDAVYELMRANGSPTVRLEDRLGALTRDLEVMTSHGPRQIWREELRGRGVLGLMPDFSERPVPRVIPSYAELIDTDPRTAWFGV